MKDGRQIRSRPLNTCSSSTFQHGCDTTGSAAATHHCWCCRSIIPGRSGLPGKSRSCQLARPWPFCSRKRRLAGGQGRSLWQGGQRTTESRRRQHATLQVMQAATAKTSVESHPEVLNESMKGGNFLARLHAFTQTVGSCKQQCSHGTGTCDQRHSLPSLEKESPGCGALADTAFRAAWSRPRSLKLMQCTCGCT